MHTTKWTSQDLRGTLRSLDTWWELVTAGVEEEALHRSVPGGTETLSQLRAASASRLAAVDGQPETQLEDAVEESLSLLSAAGRTVARLGLGAPRMTGSVAGVHVSDGGVPKRAIPSAEVGPRGLAGDRQAARRHHGRVWQALCLWSDEVIDALRAEGHPIARGRAGENITVAGVDWRVVRSGTRIRLGDVLAEITLPALPCEKNAQWFLGGDFMHMHHERHPGRNRWYAAVLESGVVRVGDPVVVEP